MERLVLCILVVLAIHVKLSEPQSHNCFELFLYGTPFVLLECTEGMLSVKPCKYDSHTIKNASYSCRLPNGSVAKNPVQIEREPVHFAMEPGSNCTVEGQYVISGGVSTLEPKSCTITAVDVVSSPSNHYVFRPDSTTVSCGTNVTGFPTPVVHWLRNGVAISDSDQYAYSDGLATVELYIANTSLEDNGTWTCVVDNGVEQKQVHSVLHVYSHPCEPLNLTEISHTSMMVNISWQPPLCEGDPAFDEYEVEIASDDTGFSATQTTDPTTVHCVFDDLAPGTQYNFTVYAVIRELSETSAPSNKLTVSTDEQEQHTEPTTAAATTTTTATPSSTNTSFIYGIVGSVTGVALIVLFITLIGVCVTYRILTVNKDNDLMFADLEDIKEFEFNEHYLEGCTNYQPRLSVITVFEDSCYNQEGNKYETLLHLSQKQGSDEYHEHDDDDDETSMKNFSGKQEPKSILDRIVMRSPSLVSSLEELAVDTNSCRSKGGNVEDVMDKQSMQFDDSESDIILGMISYDSYAQDVTDCTGNHAVPVGATAECGYVGSTTLQSSSVKPNHQCKTTTKPLEVVCKPSSSVSSSGYLSQVPIHENTMSLHLSSENGSASKQAPTSDGYVSELPPAIFKPSTKLSLPLACETDNGYVTECSTNNSNQTLPSQTAEQMSSGYVTENSLVNPCCLPSDSGCVSELSPLETSEKRGLLSKTDNCNATSDQSLENEGVSPLASSAVKEKSRPRFSLPLARDTDNGYVTECSTTTSEQGHCSFASRLNSNTSPVSCFSPSDNGYVSELSPVEMRHPLSTSYKPRDGYVAKSPAITCNQVQSCEMSPSNSVSELNSSSVRNEKGDKFSYRLASESDSGYVTEGYTRTRYSSQASDSASSNGYVTDYPVAIGNCKIQMESPYVSGFEVNCTALISGSNDDVTECPPVSFEHKCVSDSSCVTKHSTSSQCQTFLPSTSDGYVTEYKEKTPEMLSIENSDDLPAAHCSQEIDYFSHTCPADDTYSSESSASKASLPKHIAQGGYVSEQSQSSLSTHLLQDGYITEFQKNPLSCQSFASFSTPCNSQETEASYCIEASQVMHSLDGYVTDISDTGLKKSDNAAFAPMHHHESESPYITTSFELLSSSNLPSRTPPPCSDDKSVPPYRDCPPEQVSRSNEVCDSVVDNASKQECTTCSHDNYQTKATTVDLSQLSSTAGGYVVYTTAKDSTVEGGCVNNAHVDSGYVRDNFLFTV